MLAQDEKDPMPRKILEAVLIAGISAILVGFAQWGLDELKARIYKKEDEEKDDNRGSGSSNGSTS